MRSTVSASRGVLGRRGDRVGALGLVAVLGGQPHVDVLPGPVARPVRARRARASWRGRLRRRSRRRSRAPDDRRPARSVAPVALLPPRVAVVVVAVGLPEAGLVGARVSVQPAHPLGALPEVQVRDEQPRRAAVLGLERLAVVARRRPTPCRRSGPRAGGWWCSRRRTHAVTYSASVSTPSSSVSTETPVQLVSSFDHLVTQWMSTVNVSAGSARELLPGPRHRLVDRAVDRERPLVQRRVRRRAGGQHREVVDGTGRAGPGRDRRRGGAPRKPREMGAIGPRQSSHSARLTAGSGAGRAAAALRRAPGGARGRRFGRVGGRASSPR